MPKKIRSVPMKFRAVHFANECMAHRIELGLKLSDIEKLTGLSDTTIKNCENAKYPNMHIGHFILICNVYDLDPREFFELDVN